MIVSIQLDFPILFNAVFILSKPEIVGQQFQPTPNMLEHIPNMFKQPCA
jgi:hypothetical protein